MAITAQNIADKAELLLQDETNIRWTEAELLGWINSGQREIALYKPNVFIVVDVLTTVKGSRQDLPAGSIQLFDVIRTIGGGAITPVDRRVLDVTIPGWHSMPEAAAKHYACDLRNPTTFYLYPPAAAGVSIEASWSTIPASLISMDGTIHNDLYETVLIDYVLYRAYSKDAEHTANQQRAAQHQQAFVDALQGKTSAETGLAPSRMFAATESRGQQ